MKHHALPTLHLWQVLAAVKKLSAQGSAVLQLTTRLVTEEVRRPPRAARAAVLAVFQVYPGLATSLLGGADANTQQVSTCPMQVIVLEPHAHPHTHAAGSAIASTTGICVLRQRLLAFVRKCIAVMLPAFPPLLLTALSL